MAVPAVLAAAAKYAAQQAAAAAATKAASGGKGGKNDNEKNTDRATKFIAFGAVILFIIIVVTSALSTVVGMVTLVTPDVSSDESCVLFPEGTETIPIELEDGDEDGYADAVNNPDSGGAAPAPSDLPNAAGQVVFPLPAGTYNFASGYGPRVPPKPGASSFHRGLDFGTRGANPPIMAVADGVVTFAGLYGGGGNTVRVQHNFDGKVVTTVYLHALRIDVAVGQRVTKGQQIALVGRTGISTSEHLHFEVWMGTSIAQSIDPKPWLASVGASTVGGGIAPAPGLGGIYGSNLNLGMTGAEVCELNAKGTGSDSVAGTNGPWGGYENGRIPLTAMASPDFAPNARFRPDAAQALSRLNVAYFAQFGTNISITDSYRSYEGQVECRANKGNLCAVPGTSNHGWGLAADLGGGINKFDTPQHQWMVANASKHGWILPSWAQKNGSKPEAWHWEYVGVGGGDSNADGTTPAGAKQIAQAYMAQYSWSNDEFVCLDKLWTRESSWRWNADNPSSSAYGIPQALPGSKMASKGADWETNPKVQIAWGLDYIKGRYGTPCAAWAHSEAKNWY